MGTWSLPQTEFKAEMLTILMAHPLPAKIAGHSLYDIFGDDNLFDSIEKCHRIHGSDSDVRTIVKAHLKPLIENPSTACKPWEPKALEMCERIYYNITNN